MKSTIYIFLTRRGRSIASKSTVFAVLLLAERADALVLHAPSFPGDGGKGKFV